MTQLTRMFSKEKYKGTRDYVNTQKRYEVLRTVLYFAISLSLFFAGWITTKSKMNLLTIVAVLGCLPASKSAVDAIMFLRFRSCSKAAADAIDAHVGTLTAGYDFIFTSYEKNYPVAHLTIKGNTICGYTEDAKFEENAFYKHIDGVLKTDRFTDSSVKIFTDLKKYTARLDQLQELDTDEANTQGILATLKSVSL